MFLPAVTLDWHLDERHMLYAGYARSEKSWVEDPAGIAWEAYQTMEDVNLFGTDRAEAPAKAGNCCG